MELVDSGVEETSDTPNQEETSTEGETPEIANETPVAEESSQELFELPDGRKVDAATLQREWKENFLPDYTRKSQRIAEIERGKPEVTSPNDDVPKWKNPDYVPENYAEVIEIAKQEALRDIARAQQEEQMKIRSIQNQVDAQLNEIKKVDPKLDENSLFLHANKYGFSDLKVAYANMADMRKAIVATEQRTVKNIKTRDADPVSTGAAGSSVDDDGYDPGYASQFSSAVEFLSRVKGKK